MRGGVGRGDRGELRFCSLGAAERREEVGKIFGI